MQTAVDQSSPTRSAPEVRGRWLKRLGVAGFLFFLIKGLLWLIIPGLIAAGVFSS